jgi:hypothetical protein
MSYILGNFATQYVYEVKLPDNFVGAWVDETLFSVWLTRIRNTTEYLSLFLSAETSAGFACKECHL